MAWFLRVIELDTGDWACRHGTHEYDSHAQLEEALTHIKVLATLTPPAELFLHRLDGSVTTIGAD